MVQAFPFIIFVAFFFLCFSGYSAGHSGFESDNIAKHVDETKTNTIFVDFLSSGCD